MRLGRLGRIIVPAGLWLLFVSPASAALVTLTGKVTDQNGAGVFGVTINFVDSCTGVTAGAINNVTSSTGSFQATVNAGIYDLEISPPAGSLFTAQRIRSYDLTSSKTLATVVLPFGIIVSGHVTDSAGVAVADVYVHFFPPGSNERFFTVRDKTDPAGNYSVVVPTIACGLYDVKYGPPLGTRYLALTRPSVPIAGNTTLATVALATGILVTGTVNNSAGAGHPVINVNMDVVDAVTGADLDLSHDRTDATGTYTIAVPPGTYLIDVKPEKCNLLVAQESAPVTVSADTTLPGFILAAGVLVKGLVTDTRGTPVADANTNYFHTDPVTNKLVQILTWDDHSDATGAYSAVIPGNDTYTIDYFPPFTVGCPPVVQRLAAVRLAGVAINNNPLPLPTVQFPDGFLVTGRNVTVTGAPIVNVDLSFFVAGSTTNKVFVGHHHTDSAGAFSVVVVPGSYDIRFDPGTTNLAAKRLFGVSVSGDRNLGSLLLEQGFQVSGQVTDSAGSPVSGADLNFFDVYTGIKSETVHDNTDVNGNYSVVVPPRTYNVNFIPPAGVPLATVRVPNVVITASRSGFNAVLPDAFAVSGFVRNSSGQALPSVDLNFYLSGTTTRQIVSRDNTDTTGFYSVFVPPGTYDIVFTPPVTLTGLEMARVDGVVAQGDVTLPDVILGQALTPGLASIAPSSGPSSGGTAVTILGSNFQLGATVTLGGLNLLNVSVVNSGQINALAPACPVGSQGAVVDLAVSNIGAGSAVLPSAFTFTPAPVPIDITVTRGSSSIVLSWPSTGQASYTVYRSTSARQFGQLQFLAITTATSFTDVGADGDGTTYFYRVE